MKASILLSAALFVLAPVVSPALPSEDKITFKETASAGDIAIIKSVSHSQMTLTITGAEVPTLASMTVDEDETTEYKQTVVATSAGRPSNMLLYFISARSVNNDDGQTETHVKPYEGRTVSGIRDAGGIHYTIGGILFSDLDSDFENPGAYGIYPDKPTGIGDKWKPKAFKGGITKDAKLTDEEATFVDIVDL